MKKAKARMRKSRPWYKLRIHKKRALSLVVFKTFGGKTKNGGVQSS